MKHLAIFSLAGLSFLASAASPIDNMTAQCQKVMEAGNCKVALDNASYPPGGRTLVSGIGRIKNESYLKFRNTRWTMEPDGKTYTMCADIGRSCNLDLTEKDPTTDDCKAARGLWRQEPVRQASVWERVYAWAASIYH